MVRILSLLLLLIPFSIETMAQEEPLIKEQMITVKKISFPCLLPPMILVKKMMDSMAVPYHKIDQLNWDEYPYAPDVKFRIAYSKDEIFLQYNVIERFIRALYTVDEGSAPYKDSCVEFFILPNDDSTYYNLELNCIGVGTFAYGTQRRDRTRFDKSITSKIRRVSTLGREGFETQEGDFNWSITIAIPIELLYSGKKESLAGRELKANFYKCGDELPLKHYLSWSPIKTEKPDFHRPEFFGTLLFER
jgi:hypothetical protein